VRACARARVRACALVHTRVFACVRACVRASAAVRGLRKDLDSGEA
jgi:hypothetical protein